MQADYIERIKKMISDKHGKIPRCFVEDFDKLSKLKFSDDELVLIEQQFRKAVELIAKKAEDKKNDRKNDASKH